MSAADMRTALPPGPALLRVLRRGRACWALADGRDYGPRTIELLDVSLAQLLRLSVAEAEVRLQNVSRRTVPIEEVELLAPIEHQEVWAAGVTYERSRDGRVEESGAADVYQRVYDAERPELFMKATAQRVVGPGAHVGVRADSGWDAPEPELALVLSRRMEIFGFTIGNDVSSRAIEGENPLYLPQAKVYDRACSLGPAIVPVWALGREQFEIQMRIERGGELLYEGATSTGRLHRRMEDLARWLGAALSFPEGAVLLTGTGIVPEREVTLRRGDLVTISVEGLGRLENRVAVVGSPVLAHSAGA